MDKVIDLNDTREYINKYQVFQVLYNELLPKVKDKEETVKFLIAILQSKLVTN